MKKLYSLRTVFLLTISLLISCNNSSSKITDDTYSTSAASDSITDIAEETLVPDNLDTYDFEGKTFCIVYSEDQLGIKWPYDSEAENGDILNDAVYQRNAAVEERFNVNIDYYNAGGDSDQVPNSLKKSIMAGDNAYQLAVSHTFISVPDLISEAYLYNFNQLPNVDLTKPWWNQTMRKNLEINGILPIAVSDFIYSYADVIFFNKKMIETFNLDNPYELVTSGKWTWDKLSEMGKTVASDINGDDTYNKDDRFGFAVTANISLMTRMIHSNGMVMATFDSDGRPVLDGLMSDKLQTVIDKYYDLLYTGNLTYYAGKTDTEECVDVFKYGNILFMHQTTLQLDKMRDVIFDFGIIPLPKYDETQENYASLLSSQLLLVPSDIADTEFTGTIIEALSSESYRKLVPVVYEVLFENKYLRDESSYQMYQLIRKSLICDFNWNYGNGNAIVYLVGNLVGKNQSKDLSSFFEKNITNAQKSLDKVYDAFIENNT